MNDVQKASMAIDWLQQNKPDLCWFSIGVCHVDGFEGLPEICLISSDVSEAFPGEAYTIVFNHKRQLANCVIVKDGVAIMSFRYCNLEGPSNPIVVPARQQETKVEAAQ